MFVPVSCTQCGKPFQVPESALGQLAPCPWCQAVVAALPVSMPQQPTQPPPPPPEPIPSAVPDPEPFSLDDEREPKRPPTAVRVAPPGRPAEPREQPPRLDTPPTPSPAAGGYPRFVLMIALGLFIALLITAVTVGALRRKSGHFVGADWKTFRAQDGSCEVDLLGKPVEDLEAPAASGRRYSSEGWYSGARAWIGWKELTPAEVQMASGAEAWQLLRPAVFNPEKARLKAEFGGYEAEGGGTRSFDPLVVEYRLQTPAGLLVERMMVKAEGPRPRVYFVGMLGKLLTPDSPELNHLFSSFRVNE